LTKFIQKWRGIKYQQENIDQVDLRK